MRGADDGYLDWLVDGNCGIEFCWRERGVKVNGVEVWDGRGEGSLDR